jgi:hypothetical protein
MTRPQDLTPRQYEVVKLRTGTELVGMVRETPRGLQVTLPMICQLSITGGNSTLATFYPYAPLSSDPVLLIAPNDVMHRSVMNEQFIPFYDEASSKWLNMVETGTIPLTNDLHSHSRKLAKGFVDDALQQVIDATGGDITDEELDMLEEFEAFQESKEKKVIH